MSDFDTQPGLKPQGGIHGLYITNTSASRDSEDAVAWEIVDSLSPLKLATPDEKLSVAYWALVGATSAGCLVISNIPMSSAVKSGSSLSSETLLNQNPAFAS